MSDSGMGAPRDPADEPENEPGAIREGEENRRREDALANPDRDFAREQIDITESQGPDPSGDDDVDTGAPLP